MQFLYLSSLLPNITFFAQFSVDTEEGILRGVRCPGWRALVKHSVPREAARLDGTAGRDGPSLLHTGPRKGPQILEH